MIHIPLERQVVRGEPSHARIIFSLVFILWALSHAVNDAVTFAAWMWGAL